MSWVNKLFIDNAELFIRIMEKKWAQAKEEAYAIANILGKNNISQGKILDLMCGNGRLALNLARFGFEVIGLDLSEVLIRDAERRAHELGVKDNVRFYVGDARELLRILSDEAPFDAIINAWSSIGYYDEETDVKIFSEAAKLTRENGLLLIIDTVNRDAILRDFRENGVDEINELIIIRRNKFDPVTSRLLARWEIYEKQEKDLKFIAEIDIDQRLYSLHEVVDMLERAGWRFIEAYHNILTGERAKLYSPINIVARKIS